MRKKHVNYKKVTPVPEGYRQYSIKVGDRKSHTYVECTKVIHTEAGDFKCSFSKRKDKLKKDVPLEEALRHVCFSQSLDKYITKETKSEEQKTTSNYKSRLF